MTPDIEKTEKPVLDILDDPLLLSDELGKDVPGYSPNLEWTAEEEKRILWVLDTRLMPLILLSTFILNMDRTNISNAISDHLAADIHITIDDLNNAGSVYAAIFSIFTLVGAVLAKRIGPSRWIPILMFSWGLVTAGHALINDKTGFYIARVFIALTEGGVIPATLVYLGHFYKKTELATRLSWFWGVQSLASAFSGIMASGILRLRGVYDLPGWKWLFIIYGIITLFASALLYFVLPKDSYSAYQASLTRSRTGWFRSNREAEIAVTRVIRDDPIKLYYEQHVTLKDVVAAVTDSRLWGHLIITMVGLTPLTPISTYLPSIINSFGFNVYVSNALTAPGYILSFISMTLMTYHSDKTRERGFHGLLSATWLLIGLIALRFTPDTADKYTLFAVLLVVTTWPLTHPLNISWMTENMAPLGKRTVASGAIIGAANIYAVYASQIYRAKDAPRFHTGTSILIGFAIAAIILWFLQKSYYRFLNSKREHIWANFTEAEKEEYLKTTKDVGNDRLDFKFSH
ncbi:hypothetical protein HDU76_004841 [Blyttiomyces sp. JEL0837]|nr:hypothetical protein HDU76_004841 [Blyttiomyces sp. JEL0837]